MKKQLRRIVYGIRASLDMKARNKLDKFAEKISSCIGKSKKTGMTHTTKYPVRRKLAFGM